MLRAICMTVCAGVFFLGSNVHGNVIAYDNLGPDMAWTTTGVWFGHYGPNSGMTVAQKFVPNVGGPLSGLYASITYDAGTTDHSWTLRLLDDQDNYPGAVLWSMTSEQWPVEEQTIFQLESLAGPWLTAGEAYWLQADKPTVVGSSHNWSHNAQGHRGTYAISTNGGPWEVFEDEPINPVEVLGLRILVVPEPGCLSLLALGGLMLLRRRGCTIR